VIRSVIRFLVREAILNRTMAGDLVKDSSIATLEDALKQKVAPVVLIYTEDTNAKPDAKEIWQGGTVDLTILIAVAGGFTVKVPKAGGGTEDVTEFRFPATDSTSEFSIDTIEHQIKTALMHPGNPWGELFRRFVTGVEFWNSQRGASNKEGVKFAARQIVARLQVVDDPVPTGTAKGAWADLLKAMDEYEPPSADEVLGPLPAALRALVEGRPMPADYEDAIHQGLTRSQTRAIGLDRVDFDVEGPPNETASYVFTRLEPGRPR